jgi:hypothetical protein
LSLDLLCKYFLSTGGVTKVKPFEVAVQTLGGTTFKLTMDNAVHRTVEDLKEAIEQREGMNRYLQELFLLNDSYGKEEGGGEGNVGDALQRAMHNHTSAQSSVCVQSYSALIQNIIFVVGILLRLWLAIHY